jgi:hypothetical protein
MTCAAPQIVGVALGVVLAVTAPLYLASQVGAK